MDWNEAKERLVQLGYLTEEQMNKFADQISGEVAPERMKVIDILHSILCTKSHDPELGEEACLYELEEGMEYRVKHGNGTNLWKQSAHRRWYRIYEELKRNLFIYSDEEFVDALSDTAAVIADMPSTVHHLIAYELLGLPSDLLAEVDADCADTGL